MPKKLPKLPSALQGIDWYWCKLCNGAIIHCDECNYSSCCGNGCNACNDLFELSYKYCGKITKSMCSKSPKVPGLGWGPAISGPNPRVWKRNREREQQE